MEKLNTQEKSEIRRKRGVDISVEQAVQMLELLGKFCQYYRFQHIWIVSGAEDESRVWQSKLIKLF
jgi:hypothetical protein